MFVCFDDVSKSMKKLDDQRVNRWWCDIKWYCDNNVQPCTHVVVNCNKYIMSN